MERLRISTAAFLATFGLASLGRASSIDLSFNDINGSAGGTALAGQGGGTGATGNWTPASGTTPVINVITGDLPSPAGTNYPAQSGTGQSVQSPAGTTSNTNSVYRTLSTPLNGTVWFSFLVKPAADGNARVGVCLNSAGNDTGQGRIIAVGSSLFVSETSVKTGAFNLNASNLVVGEIFTQSTANEVVKIWINPDVTTFQGSTPTPTYDSSTGAAYNPGSSGGVLNNMTGGTISNLTPVSYEFNGSVTGILDNLVFSNDSNAESQVLAGVAPEPSALALLALACSGLLFRHRRTAR